MILLDFYSKKIYRNKFNLILLVVLGVVMGVLLYFNTLSNTLALFVESELGAMNEQLATTTNQEQIASIEQQIENNELFLAYYESGQYSEAYKTRIEKLHRVRDITVRTTNNDSELRQWDESIAELEVLAEHNLQYDSVHSPTKGFQFITYSTANSLIPYLLIPSLILTMASLFTDSYKRNLNIDLTYPLKLTELRMSKFTTALFYSVISYLLYMLISFGLSSLISGVGSLDYPFVAYAKDGISMHVYDTLTILQGSIILHFLLLVLLVLLVLLLSDYIRNRLYLFFVMLLLVFSQVLVIPLVPPLYGISHLFPFLYLDAKSIISYESAFLLGNLNLNFTTGIIVVVGWIVVLAAMILIKDLKKQKDM